MTNKTGGVIRTESDSLYCCTVGDPTGAAAILRQGVPGETAGVTVIVSGHSLRWMKCFETEVLPR